MSKKRIAITGLGVISSNGVGRDSFCESILNGVSGIKPIFLSDTYGFKQKSS